MKTNYKKDGARMYPVAATNYQSLTVLLKIYLFMVDLVYQFGRMEFTVFPET
jgi:hypothetical protein